jgi:AraC-like DNA-binding protein
LSVRLVTRSVWAADKPGIFTYSEYSGRAGELVDATAEGFVLDPARNLFRLRFRLPAEAEPGPWVLRESTRPFHWKQFHALFTVGPEVLPVAGPPRVVGWVLALAAGLAVAGFLALRWRQVRTALPAPYQRTVEEVKKTLGLSYASKVDFDALARTLGFTEPGLRKIFRRATGETPLQYLIAFRLSKARELLSATPDSVSDIAFHVGFGDPAYFMKAFKRKFRMTPSEWRERGGRG